MPTIKSVQKMAAISFDPLIVGNPHIFKKSVSKNSTEIKTINGRTISFTGAQPQKVDGDVKDSANLRSDPCDRIDRDEIDLMDPDMVEMSKQRLQRSLFRKENNWGSPTTPNYGIDLLYENSDRRKWQIKCLDCGKYTCLGESFPDSITKIGGFWARTCVHCKSEIFVHDGQWIAEDPESREAGFWVSGLLSPYCDLEDAMYRYEHNDKTAEFMRSILGIATTDADVQLTRSVITECCNNDGMKLGYSGESCMGVDINKTLDATVGIRTGADQYQVLSTARFDNYDQLHDYSIKMGVKTTVMDAGPYDHGAREYQKDNSNVHLCYYSESQPGKPVWDWKNQSVKVNRNEWCDKVYSTFTEQKIVIPRTCPTMDTYINQLTCTEKSEVVNTAGISKPRWCKRGRDDAFHSTLYMLLALSRSPITKLNGKKRKRPKFTVNNFV